MKDRRPDLEGLVPGSPEAVAAAKAALVARRRSRELKDRRNKRLKKRREGDMTPEPGEYSPIVAAFARRFEADAMTPDDRDLVERVKAIDALRAEGHTWDEVGVILGTFRGIVESRERLRQFVKQGIYAYIHEALEKKPDAGRPEPAPDRKTQATIREARENIAELLPTAVEFLRDCLRKKLDSDEWMDPARAEWAVQQLVKAAALDEGADRPAPEVSVTTVRQMEDEVDSYDEVAERSSPERPSE
jgi:hypothetical protein